MVLALVACVVLGAALRVTHLAQAPTIRSDGPGYIGDARQLEWDSIRSSLFGYYPPLFSIFMRGVHDVTGLSLEASGRGVSLVAGIVTVGLVGVLAMGLMGAEIGWSAALLAALHTYLVRMSTAVLPEMLFGCFVATWGVLLLLPGGLVRVAAGAAIGALSTMARVEGIALAPLSVLAAWVMAPPGRRGRRVLIALAASVAVLGPLLALARVETGEWALSGKEMAIIARRFGFEETSLLGLVLEHPGTLLAHYPENLRRQLGYVMSVVLVGFVPLAVVGFATHVVTGAARRARAIILMTLGVFTFAVAIINPGKRYVIALLPLLLPWMALGARALVAWVRDRNPRVARFAPLVVLVAIVGLSVHAALPERARWAPCFDEICAWLDARHGDTRPPVMARDSRIAYLCDVPYVHEPRLAGPRRIATVVRERGARVWIVKAGRAPAVVPSDLHRVATLCEGRQRVVVYE